MPKNIGQIQEATQYKAEKKDFSVYLKNKHGQTLLTGVFVKAEKDSEVDFYQLDGDNELGVYLPAEMCEKKILSFSEMVEYMTECADYLSLNLFCK